VEIIGSIVQHRETFLSRREWMERPWQLLPKTPLELLADPLFDVPAILQQLDEVSREANQTILQDGLRDIIAKCLKVESALRGSYRSFKNSVSGPLYWPELSTLESHLDDTRLGKLFPVSYHFPTFFVAQVITKYWSGMMVVHYLLTYTHNKLAAIQSSKPLTCTTNTLLWPISASNLLYSAIPSALPCREHSDKLKTMVRSICQSVEYFLQDEMGGLGPLTMLLQLRGCKNCLEGVPEDWSREISWITDYLERIQKKFNLSIYQIGSRIGMIHYLPRPQ
jgi:hypothetical protein